MDTRGTPENAGTGDAACGRRTLDALRFRLDSRAEETVEGLVVGRPSVGVPVGQTARNAAGHRLVLGEIFLMKPHCLALYKDLARASTERASRKARRRATVG